MDSDSSLDGEFETKHEIAVKLRRNSSEQFHLNDSGSDVASEHSLGGSSQIQSPPPEEKGELSPRSIQSVDGELTDTSNEDGRTSRSSYCSKRSDVVVSSAHLEDNTTDNNCSTNAADNVYSSPPIAIEEKPPVQVVKRDEITGHGEDLSDVSDLDSNDGQGSLDAISEDERSKEDGCESNANVCKRGESECVEEMEQLDFEAEEQQEKEEGECEAKDEKSEDDGELKGDELEEGELTDEDEHRPEETEPRPVCRFYNRGQCTWGSSCRFVHPGVTDKGNYTMFDMVRPLVPVNGPSVYPPVDYRYPYEKPVGMSVPYQASRKEEPIAFESAWERGLRQAKEMMRKSNKRKETDMDFEEKKMNLSLGQEELDKENDYYTRPASPVFKDDERWGMKLDTERYRDETAPLEHFDDVPESPYYHQRGNGNDYWRRVHYESGDTRGIRVEAEYTSGRDRSSSKYHGQHKHRQPSQEFYDKYEKKYSRQKSHSVREVIVERVEKPWREERYEEVAPPARRGDEWADPWMRSKSPVGRKRAVRPARPSYSSGTSYSSSSSSRSSSRSSYSSYSHGSHSRSRSKSRSISRSVSRSGSLTPLSHGRRKPNKALVPNTRLGDVSPTAMLNMSPRRTSKQLGEPRGFGKNKPLTSSLIQSEKKAASERALLMNPPAPSPRKQKEARVPSPGMMRKSAQNPPPPPPPPLPPSIPMPPPSSARRSKSSRSSSCSESSGSSSDSQSSESSGSSSSSSRETSPQATSAHKRSMIDERGRLALAAENLKVKAMDALKLSGQKQQIKLTLKNTAANAQTKTKTTTGLPELPELNLVRRDRALPTLVAKKRQAESSFGNESGIAAKMAALAKPSQKKATSRREELLKQLKAVEDAIARKRSKI